jgi:hypothetical protein
MRRGCFLCAFYEYNPANLILISMEKNKKYFFKRRIFKKYAE